MKATCNFGEVKVIQNHFNLCGLKNVTMLSFLEKRLLVIGSFVGATRLFSGCSSNEFYFDRTKLLNRKPGSFRSFS